MRHPQLLDRRRALLVVIDLQEAYRPILRGWDGVVNRAALLVRGAGLLGIPVLVTEQYPRGLGRTAPEVATALPSGVRSIEKMSMSCYGAEAFRQALAGAGCSQVLVAGIETHACVNQTVHDLLAAGYEVHLAVDATSSRRTGEAAIACERMQKVGALPTSTEQALLELVRTADASEFKALQRLLKDVPAERP